MTHPALNTITACRLADLIRACQGNRKVKWAVDGDVGRILEGTARAITTEGGNFLHRDTDIRDGYVWISSTFEHFLPVSKVLALMEEDLFVVPIPADA